MSEPWIEGFPARGSPRERCPRVLTPVWPEIYILALLSDTLWQRLLHYDATIGRTVPCLLSKQCAYCPGGFLRPVGYIAALLNKPRGLRILQLSDSAMKTLESLHREHGHMRGLTVETSRADKRANAQQLLRFTGVVPAELLVPDFDPRPALERMWGWSLQGLFQRTSPPATEEAPKRRQRR